MLELLNHLYALHIHQYVNDEREYTETLAEVQKEIHVQKQQSSDRPLEIKF